MEARRAGTRFGKRRLGYVLAPGASLGFAINDLEDELGRVFRRPVDLVSKRSLHPLLREQVLADAERIAEGA